MNETEIRMPKGFVTVDFNEPMGFTDAAMFYARYLLNASSGRKEHECPVCGSKLWFRFCEVYGDPYMDYVMAGCNHCKVFSDACYFRRYNISPIELATGAVQSAINEFERRIKP